MQRCLEQYLDRNLYRPGQHAFSTPSPPHTEGARVCTSDSSDHQGFYAHSGSAGFAGTRFAGKSRSLRERRNRGRYVEEAGARSRSMRHMIANESMGIVKGASIRIEGKGRTEWYISGVGLIAARAHLVRLFGTT
jgi:hypothetical protein